jgi:lipoprotein-releasing system ATP-binding protein
MKRVSYASGTMSSTSCEAPVGRLLDSFAAIAESPAQRSAPAQSAAVSRSSAPLLCAKKLFKSYRKSKHIIPVLRGVDFSVHRGEFVAVVGQSGSGKSTLLHLLGTLDGPDAGEIHFEGNRVDNLPSTARDLLRNRYFGMIFQFYHLLPELTALENILAPRMIGDGVLRYWFNKRKHAAEARRLLELVGLDHRLNHKPKELSGGEMQRAAIARALIASPQLLLADEPTGNLDRQTGEEIMDLLRTLNRRENLTIVMVTHDNAIAALADRTVRLVEGLVERVG